MKKCPGCMETKDLDEFNFKNERKDTRQSRCKVCTRIQLRQHYAKNIKYYLVKAKKHNDKNRETVLAYIREYLSKRFCVDCGENDPTVLEFDHRSGKEKIKAVSSLIGNRSPLYVVADEIAKCEVRCANCHRRKTARDFGWRKLLPS